VHGDRFAGGYRGIREYESSAADLYDVATPLSPPPPQATATAKRWSFSATSAAKGAGRNAPGKEPQHRAGADAPAADTSSSPELLNGAMLSTSTAAFATLVLASVGQPGRRVLLPLTSAGHLPH